PMAALLLHELGADVLRVERPAAVGTPPDWLARGRRCTVADLKDPSAREAVLSLAAQADVLIEGFRPGVAERLGLGPDEIHARNPALVYGRMTGWGQDGPWAPTAGHDINYIALTGVLGAIGTAGGPPQIPLNLVGDFGGGALYLVMGVLAALHEARSSGRGQVVDCAIVDGTTSLAAMIWAMRDQGVWTDTRGTNLLDSGAPYYAVYETADGGWFSVGAIEPQFYAQFVDLLGLPEWADAQHDTARWPALRAAIATAFAGRTRAEWEAVFTGTDACAAPVLGWDEAGKHPHMAARGNLVDIGGATVPAPAPRFSRTPGRVAGPAPAVGSTPLSAAQTRWNTR
ncbi:CaiB/BaiF CoA-transferase family protein, partial [Frankia sp. EI5c]|uniref:CaiB/BaiF CoA transferase family protein n=1 Tax=Frankia sp. EI5c TaxID=683316 RepID=UPI001F5BA8E2